jgi:hypothetical protein
MMKVIKVTMVVAALLLCLCHVGEASFQGTELYIPLVQGGEVTIDDRNAEWYTDLYVYNPNSEPVTLTFVPLLAHRSVGDPGYQFYPVDRSVGARELLVIEDACHYFFPNSNDSEWTMYIHAALPVLVSARSYLVFNDSNSGEINFFTAAIPASFGIGEDEKTQILGVRHEGTDDESVTLFDFGIVEIGGESIDVEVSLFDEHGSMLSSQSFSLSKFEPKFYSLVDLDPPFPVRYELENARLEVEVTNGDGNGDLKSEGMAMVFGSRSLSTSIEMQFPDHLLAENVSPISKIVAHSGLDMDEGIGEDIGVVTLWVDIDDDGGLELGRGADDQLRISDGGVNSRMLGTEVGESGMVLTLDDALQLTWATDQQGVTGINVGPGLNRTEEGAAVTLNVIGDSDGGIRVTGNGVGVAPYGIDREMLATPQGSEPSSGMVLALDDALQLNWATDQQGVADISVGAGLNRTEEGGAVTLDVIGDSDNGIRVTENGVGVAPFGVTREMLATPQDGEPSSGMVLALSDALELTWATDQQGIVGISVGPGLSRTEEGSAVTLNAVGDSENGIGVGENGIGISDGGVSLGKIGATGAEPGRVLSIGAESSLVWTDTDTVTGDVEGTLDAVDFDFDIDDGGFFTLRLAWDFPGDGELVIIEGFKGDGRLAASYTRSEHSLSSGDHFSSIKAVSCSYESEKELLVEFDDHRVELNCTEASANAVDPDLRLTVSGALVAYRLTQ